MNVIWLKRDLRLFDSESVYRALLSDEKIIILYIFEPSLLSDYHYSERHFNFIKQSLENINQTLLLQNAEILVIEGEAAAVFEKLNSEIKINQIFSHQETGIKITFDRDKLMAKFCKKNAIIWNQYITNGVKRGISNRKTWKDDWVEFMDKDQFPFLPTENSFIDKNSFEKLQSNFEIVSLETEKNSPFQKGGTQTAFRYLNSFLSNRVENYSRHISKPDLARTGCSRLSPYIAWGNISMKQICHKEIGRAHV